MKADKLTRDEAERLALKHLHHLERQKQASAKRRAKLQEQGKTQITLMVSAKRAEQVKKMIKTLEEKDLKRFALAAWDTRGEPEKAMWSVEYDSEKSK